MGWKCVHRLAAEDCIAAGASTFGTIDGRRQLVIDVIDFHKAYENTVAVASSSGAPPKTMYSSHGSMGPD